MVQMLHFHCPACGTTLQLPFSMGGQQGPCPRCYQEIIAPNPERGVGPRLAPYVPPPPPAPPEPEPFTPFSDSPPVVPRSAQPSTLKTEPILTRIAAASALPIPRPAPEPEPEIIPPEPRIVCAGPQRMVLFLSCALATTAGLAIGYLVGQRTPNLLNSSSSAPVITAPKPTPPIVKTVIPPKDVMEAKTPAVEVPSTPAPESAPPAAGPVPEPDDSPAPKPPEAAQPTKISDQAMAALKAFLEAPDWAARSAYILHADQLNPAMEAYSREVPDGPTVYTSVQVANSGTDPETGETLFIFQVNTASMPDGIPVAVQETAKGWLVDWPTFVEFRDDRFEKFATDPADGTGTFHLIARTPPEGEDQAKNEYFVTYLLTPPMPDRQRPAFCKKNSQVQRVLQRTTPEGNLSNLVLEVAKRTTPDGKTHYLEITNVKATDWRPSSP